jgi:Putative Actinobacterial Holin-X, holin superfamily III
MMATLQVERSLGELFSELSQEVSTLFRQEAQLAKVEMSQKASQAGRSVGLVAAGGAVAYAGFLALLAALILGLAQIMAGWLAALIVGLVVAGIGYAVVQKGLSELKNMNLAPEKTLKTLREDGQWLKQQLN